MSRTFAYCRVSTRGQTTENQTLAIRNRGYDIEDQFTVHDIVSGSTPAMNRPNFAAMVNHSLFRGDSLVVLKLDRLGRDNIDVQSTINMLQAKGVRVICLDLPEPDLSTPTGKLMLQLFAVFAEFERNRIIERTQDGLARARASGKHCGRRAGSEHTAAVQKCKADGMSQSQTAAALGIHVNTVKRRWNTPTE